MRIAFHEFRHIAFSDGEMVSFIAPDRFGEEDFEEDVDLEIYYGGQMLFDGKVISAMELSGLIVVNAVETSVASGGDPGCAAIGRASEHIGRILDGLGEWERKEVLSRVNQDVECRS